MELQPEPCQQQTPPDPAQLSCLVFIPLFTTAPSPTSTVKDLAGNPLHPTSTAHILTLQPIFFASSANGVYFAFFSSLDTSILFSLGTVSSMMPSCFVLSDISSMSGLRLVIVMLLGIFRFPFRSTIT